MATDARTLPPISGTEPQPRRSASPAAPSSKACWVGRVLSGLAVLFLAFDAAMKVLQLPPALKATTELGYPPSAVLGIGLVQVACLVVYLVPRTAVLGAVLWTGYLGGAVASQVRVGNPLFSHVLFPIYVAALLWAGLWLRDARLPAVFAPR
jgi:DoxX-like family